MIFWDYIHQQFSHHPALALIVLGMFLIWLANEAKERS